MATEYTVGEMAQRLAREGSAAEVAALTRQLRNWTALGLLTPRGEKHEGTGKHRRYDDRTLLKAALIELLVRNLRIDITGLQSFVAKHDLQDEFFSKMLTWEMTQRPEGIAFWAAFDAGRHVQFGFEREPEKLAEEVRAQVKAHEVVLVIDLAPIARRIFR
jgi:DNA-binding transcriptional MerR regulator